MIPNITHKVNKLFSKQKMLPHFPERFKARKSLGYKTHLEYCKQMFIFEVCCFLIRMHPYEIVLIWQ